MASISEPYKLNFKKGKEGAVTVTDVQGNTANVLTANLGSSTHAIHKIDKVLFSGELLRLGGKRRRAGRQHAPCHARCVLRSWQ